MNRNALAAAAMLAAGLCVTACEGCDDTFDVPPRPITWSVVTNSPFSGTPVTNINAIAYGGNVFVAVGEGGKIAYSFNGANWMSVNASPFGSASINAVAYGVDRFVAGGTSGAMAYSLPTTTGAMWSPVTNSQFGANNIMAIAYGGGKFVAVGAGGTIAYSIDSGTNWTPVANSTFGSSLITGIAYGGTATGGGVFVAGDQSGKIAYSADGVTWTAAAASPFAANTRAIAYGSGRFVAGTNGSRITMAYSANGAAWATTHGGDLFLGGSGIMALAYGEIAHPYGGGRFVAGGASGKAAYSADGGLTWTAYTFSDAFPTISVYAIAYGEGTFVAGATQGIIVYGK